MMPELLPSNPTLFNRNLRRFAKEYPQMSAEIKGSDLPSGAQVYSAKNGSPTLLYEFRDRKVSIHSKYNPEKEAKRWAEGLGTDWDILILYGLGLGYHLKSILELYPNKQVVLVEHGVEALAQAMGFLDLTEAWEGQVHIVISKDPREAAALVINFIKDHASKKQSIEILPGYENIFKDYWNSFGQALRDGVTLYRGNIATQIHYQKTWLENFRNNFFDYLDSPGVNTLFNSFKNVPIIIVSSGPSLEKNIHLLPQVRGKAIVLAAGSAIGPLLRNGIVPDLLVSFDPSEANFQHFRDIDSTNIRLAFASTIYHQILTEYKGPRWAFELNFFPFDKWIGKIVGRPKGELRSAPTVSAVSLDLALKMGGNPVIFIGQDLAYTDMKSHATGSRHRQEVSLEKKGLFKTEGVMGPVYTDKSFWNMKLNLERIISSTERTVINATEGGLRIEGTTELTLEQVISTYCNKEHDFDIIFDESLLNKKQLDRADFQQLQETFEMLQQEIEWIKDSSKEAVKKANLLISKGANIASTRLSKQMKQLKQIERRVMRTKLFEYFIQSVLRGVLEINSKVSSEKISAVSSQEEKVRQIGLAYLKWFKLIEETVEFLEMEVISQIAEKVQETIEGQAGDVVEGC